MTEDLKTLLGSNSLPIRDFLICAHRGDRRYAPENSLPAFNRSIDLGVDGIEFDVRPAADGCLVVCHDRDLNRLSGRELVIGETSYRELKDVNIGEYKGEKVTIPLFSEVLDLMKDKVLPIIELKTDGERLPGFASHILEILHSREMAERCIVSSFDLELLSEMHSMDSSLYLSQISADTLRSDLDWLGGYHPSMDIALDCNIPAERWSLVWTVNDEQDGKTLKEKGLDGVISDDPRPLFVLRN